MVKSGVTLIVLLGHLCHENVKRSRDIWEGIFIKLTSPTVEKVKYLKAMVDDEIVKGALHHPEREEMSRGS